MKKISSFLLLLFLLAIVPAVVMLEVLFHDGLPEAQGQQAASQLEQSIRDHLPFQQQLRQMVTEVRYRLGMREQSSVFISENSLVENVSGPYGDFVRQNTQAILDFTERYGVSTYVALIPNSCVIRQDEIPPLATVYNQKSLFDYVYDRLAGSAICIDTYTSLYANNDKYLYYRTKELPTSLGGFYIYTAVGGKLGVAPREIEQFAIRPVLYDYYGELYEQFPYDRVQADILSVYELESFHREYQVTHYDGEEETLRVYYTLYPLYCLKEGQDATDLYLGGLSPRIDIRSTAPFEKRLLVFGDETMKSYLPFLTIHYDLITFVDLNTISDRQLEELDVYEYDQVLFAYSAESFMHTDIPSGIDRKQKESETEGEWSP